MARAVMTVCALAAAATALAASLTGVGVAPARAASESFLGPDYPDPAQYPDCQPTINNKPINGALVPSQWMSIVGLPTQVTETPKPQRVVVGEMDQTADVAGVIHLLTSCGRPVPPIVQFPSSGTAPVGIEATLDATIVASALPPNAQLIVAVSPTIQQFAPLFETAAQACGIDTAGPTPVKMSDYPEGGCIISISYGSNENTKFPTIRADTAATNTLLSQLEGLGVIVVVSAGDESSGGCSDTRSVNPFDPLPGGVGGLTPRWPSTNPAVVGVGGTQWDSQVTSMQVTSDPPYTPGATYSQNVWKDTSKSPKCVNYETFPLPAPNLQTGASGGGGGQSSYYPMPSYQSSAAAQNYPGNTGMRMSPDVAALAAWPKYALYMNNAWGSNGGTSAAAPSVAVGIANVNATLSARGLPVLDNAGGPTDIHTAIYNPANASALTDVTQGDNMLFEYPGGGSTIVPGYSPTLPAWQALPGYDMASGMGVINFTDLANNLITQFTPVPPTPVPPTPVPPAPAPGPGPGPSTDPTPAQIANPSVAPATPLVPAVQPEAATAITPVVRRLIGGVSVATGLPSNDVRTLRPRTPSRAPSNAPHATAARGGWIAPVLRLPANRDFVVHVRVGERWTRVGSFPSNAGGTLTIDALRFTQSGRYELRATGPGGRAHYYVIDVR